LRKGDLGTDKNHAKIGVLTSGNWTFTVFGDMNQQGDAAGYTSGRLQSFGETAQAREMRTRYKPLFKNCLKLPT
jgi:hypothetical protein